MVLGIDPFFKKDKEKWNVCKKNDSFIKNIFILFIKLSLLKIWPNLMPNIRTYFTR